MVRFFVLFCALIASCSDNTVDSGGDGSSTHRDGGGCPSQVLCGLAGRCCATGEACIGGQCVTACETGVRCGDRCCGDGELCLAEACMAPGEACVDSYGCDDGAFCELTVGRCLPQPPNAVLCQIRPPTPKFEPKIEWSWTKSAIKPTHVSVVSMPVVLDVDKDGIPEVVIVTGNDYQANGIAYLRLLDGRTGNEKWPASADVYKDTYAVNPRGTPAAADLNGDGNVEIVAPKSGGGVLAFNADGSFLWRSTRKDGTTAYDGVFTSCTVALADMNQDGKGEAVVGGVVLDYRGRLVSDSAVGRERWGSNSSGYGPVSVIADVDGDPKTRALYVVTGNRAIGRNGTLLWDVSSSLPDGYVAVTDFDKDGAPELVVTATDDSGDGEVRVQSATDGMLIHRLKVPGNGRGGPPTIADFDGDGAMEIASANGTNYNVFEYDVAKKRISVKWSKTTQDTSSNVTGSSVFDFEGDGAAEVVYNDECYARVYDGKTGDVLFQVQNSSATIFEYPVLVDVDGDNHTEFVVAANDIHHKKGVTVCRVSSGSYAPRTGVFVYGDTHDRWVRTRRIWNQHAYHITNISATGSLPAPEAPSWGSTGDRTYRVSSQGTGVFNAPDLQVDLEISSAGCPTALLLRARVANRGSMGVASGVAVAFYRGTDASGTPLANKETTSDLLPGQSEVVEFAFRLDQGAPPDAFFVTVDNGSDSKLSSIAECKEDNNQSGIGGARCFDIH